MKMLPFVAAAALLALGGCATPFNAKVSRFQQLPPAAGQSFVVRAADPRLDGGIEFNQYAQIVSAKLAQQGYQPAPDNGRAALIVKIGYGVDKGREKVVSSPGFGGGYGGFGPGFGRYGGGYGRFGYYGRSRFAFGFNDPFLFDNDVSSFTIYTSELDLRIDRADTGKSVFEGTAKAQSRNDDLPYLVPRLVEAMFTGFPGNSGETVKITIAPEKK